MSSSPGGAAVRIGLAGVGRTGFGRIRNELTASGLFTIAAAFDLLPDRTRQLCDQFGATAHDSFPDLLANPAVELVVIATRSDTHAALATQALHAGKRVIVEKPLATNLADADALIALARDLQGPDATPRLFVRHNRRFDPAFDTARHILASGKLGRLHSVQIRVGEYVRRTDWQTLRRCGGGQLLNWGPHAIDWALQLLGGRADSVWADLKLLVAAGDAEDHAKLLLTSPPAADGHTVLADLEISGANAANQPLFVLAGDRGAVTIEPTRARLKYLRTPPDRATLVATDAVPRQEDKRYKSEAASDWLEEDLAIPPAATTTFWTSLHATLREGQPFPITLDQAREVMRVIEVCRTCQSQTYQQQPSRAE